MAKKLKNPDPHRMQVIAWKDGAKKEIVMRCLNDPAVTKEMPQDIVGNAGAMVLWGARRLRDLARAGQLREQVAPMFSSKPEEVKELESRIKHLEEMEVGYVKTINNLTRVMDCYRDLARKIGIKVDEDKLTFTRLQ